MCCDAIFFFPMVHFKKNKEVTCQFHWHECVIRIFSFSGNWVLVQIEVTRCISIYLRIKLCFFRCLIFLVINLAFIELLVNRKKHINHLQNWKLSSKQLLRQRDLLDVSHCSKLWSCSISRKTNDADLRK